MGRLKIAVLISGRGSNLSALINACKSESMPASIVAVISNRPDAAGLVRAQRAGLPITVIDHRQYRTRKAFEVDLDTAIRDYQANFVCNAGFMRILTEWFVRRWYDKHLNVHPSLLPAYPGLDTHKRAIKDGARITGCTVHFVRATLDTGPILIQAAVPVLQDDTPNSLADRVLATEHKIYPAAVRLLAEGRVSIINERVIIDDLNTPEEAFIINPDAGC